MAQPEPGPSSAPVEIAEIDEDEAFKVHFESNDPRNPKSFHPLYKAWLVFLMGLLAMTGALGSSIISPGSAQIADYTHVKREVTSLTVALFILGDLRKRAVDSSSMLIAVRLGFRTHDMGPHQ